MMKTKILPFLIFISSYYITNAQAPQFAVVRPDGTTYICPTWDSAYNKAIDGDNIYLPGVPVNGTFYIDKRLNIFGAGHHPDSSSVSGKTTILGSLFFRSGASGGSIEGVHFTTDIYLSYTGRKIRDIQIKRCRLGSLNFNIFGNPTPSIDSLPINITITENLIIGYLFGENSSGNTITKNIIQGQTGNFISSYVANNIFLY